MIQGTDKRLRRRVSVVAAITMLAMNMAACEPAADGIVPEESNSWRRVAELTGAGTTVLPGYSSCDESLLLNALVEAVVCRLAEGPGSLATPPLQMVIISRGSPGSLTPGPTFGDAYKVSLAAFHADDGSDTVLVLAESETEYPQGVDVYWVVGGQLVSVGLMDLIGLDDEGEATSLLPLVTVTGSRRGGEISIGGPAAALRPDGSYAGPPDGDRFCFAIRDDRMVAGTAAPGGDCRTEVALP